MSQPGYPDKKPGALPPIITGTYQSHGTKTPPPDAAKFNRGAQSIEQVRQATEQRRAHNNALSNPGRAGYKKQSPFS
jgi:hypothetical protein